jgi:hypothetical protein
MGMYDDYYRQLSEQNSGLGDYAVNYTNEALKSNPNISEFIKSKSNYGLYSPDQNSITTDPKTFLGLDQSTWGGLAAGGQLLGGAIGAYTGLEKLGLAKKVADYNMAMEDKQYAMAKDAYDRNVARATSISDQMAKGKVG